MVGVKSVGVLGTAPSGIQVALAAAKPEMLLLAKILL